MPTAGACLSLIAVARLEGYHATAEAGGLLEGSLSSPFRKFAHVFLGSQF